MSAMGICGTIINAVGQPKIPMLICFCLLVIDIPLNYYLVEDKGTIGAALSTFAISALGLLLLATYVLKRFKSLLPKKVLFNILMAGTIQAFVLVILVDFHTTFLSGIITILLSLLIYGFILFSRKVIEKDSFFMSIKGILNQP